VADADFPDFRPMSPPIVQRDALGHSGQPGAAPRQWPTVVGVICLVLGVLGLLQGACGLVGNLVIPLFMDHMPKGAGGTTSAMTTQFQPYLLSVAAVALMLSSLLTTGGIALTKRKRWASAVLLHWSWLRMLVVVAALVLNYLVMQQQFAQAMEQASANNPTVAMPPWFSSMMSAIGSVGIAWGLAWGWALPIFCLIWFNRARIRAEVSEWP